MMRLLLRRAIPTSEGDTDVNAEDSEARLRARALSRWESEGGALAPAARADAIDETTLRLLAQPGATDSLALRAKPG